LRVSESLFPKQSLWPAAHLQYSKDDGGALSTNERIIVGCQLVEGTRQEGVGRRVELGLNINSSALVNAGNDPPQVNGAKTLVLDPSLAGPLGLVTEVALLKVSSYMRVLLVPRI
jgi:hypothetical protein